MVVNIVFANTEKNTLAGDFIQGTVSVFWVRLATGRADLHLSGKGIHISRLQVDSPRTSKPASKTFAGTEVRHDSTRCNALDLVFTVPGDEMTIVNKVVLFVFEL